MKSIDKVFLSEREKQAFVDECEAAFEARLDEICAAVRAREGVRYVLLSGPSCACKSTVVKKLVEDEVSEGKRIHMISIDDFFLSRGEDREAALAKGEKLDFDSIDALDLPLFKECLQGIFLGERVMLPTFDFVSAARSGYTAFDAQSVDIIIFEGIQAIYPEITALFRGREAMSIYIDVEGPINAYGKVFTGRDVRFARRIVRDYLFRNASPAFTMFLWESVTENEVRSMDPYAHTADVHLDSFIPYEFSILKKPLTDTLSLIGEGDKYYGQAAALLDRFRDVPEIDSHYLPPDSMYREFLGKE